ncbi:FG-GAP repeat domain-containing protein [Ramlibacter sp. MMS24-I3-19]|uniref:FG-GAP repeat domain-containing protein n=1 Tax=Ramlibacter sp. MMS24-I3-19 TaxID=3416606 RepID=UPI003D0877F5
MAPTVLPAGDNTMRAWADFRRAGVLDYFRAELTYDTAKPPADATPSRFEFWKHNPNGTWTDETATLLPKGSAGCVHPRKVLVADFNGDGRPDLFVGCTGYDAPPFPGETSKVVLSQADGTYAISDASPRIAYTHGSSAADINGDGKIDIIATDSNSPERAYVLVNDGTGHFAVEAPGRLPTAVTTSNGGWYSLELVDVDGDGKLDLVMGGHEFQNAPNSVFINPGTSQFASVTPVVLPAVADQGVSLDYTVTGSGSSRAIWISRTSGSATSTSFYQSRVVQKVAYPSLGSTVVLDKEPGAWMPWLIPAIVNGQAVVTSDNESEAVSFPQ